MNEEKYISFESYLSNEMPSDEKKIFEKQLQNDSQLNESFKVYKETSQFLNTKFTQESASFKTNLKSISKNNFESETALENKNNVKVISFKPWQYAVAATIALFIGTFFFMQNGEPSYLDYNQHEEAAFTERGEVARNLKLAQDAFNTKEYKKSIPLFESVLTENSLPEIDYFYAIALLETNDFTKAEEVFLKLKLGKSIYKDKANWYLGLSKLKQKKYDDCKEYLNQISVDDEDYNKAQNLLKELK